MILFFSNNNLYGLPINQQERHAAHGLEPVESSSSEWILKVPVPMSHACATNHFNFFLIAAIPVLIITEEQTCVPCSYGTKRVSESANKSESQHRRKFETTGSAPFKTTKRRGKHDWFQTTILTLTPPVLSAERFYQDVCPVEFRASDRSSLSDQSPS